MNTTENTRLRAFWPFLMDWEGRTFESDPDDPGGATKFGIDQRSHPRENIRALTEERAFEIYAQEWRDAGCDEMPSPFAEVFFDTAVNQGLGRAREFMQSAQDAFEFLQLREAFYRGLARRKPRMVKYLRGWLNRTGALRARFKIEPAAGKI